MHKCIAVDASLALSSLRSFILLLAPLPLIFIDLICGDLILLDFIPECAHRVRECAECNIIAAADISDMDVVVALT